MEDVKFCTKCKLQRPIILFSKDKHKKDGFRPSCKTCDKQNYKNQLEASKRWRAKNKDKVKAGKQAYYHRVLRRPRPPKDPTAPARAKKAWKLRNPAKMAMDRVKRRKHVLQATPHWANTVAMQQVYVLAQYMSYATGVAWHVDHIVPIRNPRVCGLHVENNLTFSPAAFNLAKSNKFDDWVDFR